MTLEPLYLGIRVLSTYVFSFGLFLDKFTSAVSVTVVLLLIKVPLKKGLQKRPGNMGQLYSPRSPAPKRSIRNNHPECWHQHKCAWQIGWYISTSLSNAARGS